MRVRVTVRVSVRCLIWGTRTSLFVTLIWLLHYHVRVRSRGRARVRVWVKVTVRVRARVDAVRGGGREDERGLG